VSLDGAHEHPYNNWAIAATNIQTAVDAQYVGGVTIVSNGNYETSGAATPGFSLDCRVKVNKPMMLQSYQGPEVTIISGQGPPGDSAVRCAYLTNRVVVSGFTLSNGFTRLLGDDVYEQSGGGALLDNGGLLTNCIIIENYAYKLGAGVYCLEGGKINFCRIIGNSSANGGAVYIDATGVVYRSTLKNNWADENGGAVFISQGGALYDSLLIKNSSGINGGGVYWDILGEIQNCTISDNSANAGGGIFGGGYGSALNSIITFNSATQGSNVHGSVSCSFCCSAPLQTGSGNITGDPGFINHGGQDYKLRYGSICFNSGDNQPGQMFSKDIIGNDRIICGTADLGAFEMSYGIGSPNVAVTSVPELVEYHITDFALSGTNNSEVLGQVWWSNITAQTTGNTIPDYTTGIGWSADITLLHGDNQINVYGSNYTGTVAWDSTVIHRETYDEAIPKIETNALIYPSGGSSLVVSQFVVIVWNPERIHDDIDGTNLTITRVTALRTNDIFEVAVIATNISNLNGTQSWFVPEELLVNSTDYLLKFEVEDSNSLTNSRMFFDNSFIVIPEPVAGLMVLVLLCVLKSFGVVE